MVDVVHLLIVQDPIPGSLLQRLDSLNQSQAGRGGFRRQRTILARSDVTAGTDCRT